MLDESIDEMREIVNSHKLKNNDTNSKNGTAEGAKEQLEEAKSRTDKMVGDNLGTKKGSNLLKVKNNSVEGLTFEIREGLYSKLNGALNTNLQNTLGKENTTTMTETDICNIARKVEFSIFSTAKDLNSYKLSGVNIVVQIEKQTRNFILCEMLSAEIELLKLRAEMRMSMDEDDPKQQPTLLLGEAKSISQEEFQSQDDQSNTELKTEDTEADKSADLPVSHNVTASESEYFSCSDHRISIEIQQNNESCTLNSNPQDQVVNILSKNELKNLESSIDIESQSALASKNDLACNNNNYLLEKTTESNNDSIEILNNSNINNYVLEKTTESNNDSIEILSNSKNNNHVLTKTTESNNDSIEILSNSEAQIVLPSADEAPVRKKRKRQPTLKIFRRSSKTTEPSDTCLPIQHNKDSENLLKESNAISDKCAEDSPPRKKLKESQNETNLDTSDIEIVFTQTVSTNNNNIKTFETRLKDCSLIKLEKDQDDDISVAREEVANKTQQMENIKVEETIIKDEPGSPLLTDLKDIALKKNLIKEEFDENYCLVDRKGNIISTDEKIRLQDRINKSELVSPEMSTNIVRNVKCRIKNEIDISCYSLPVDDEKSIDKVINESLVLETENVSLTDKNSSDAKKNNTISPSSETSLGNISSSSIPVAAEEINDKVINESLVLETVNVSLADKKSSDAQKDNIISPSSETNLGNISSCSIPMDIEEINDKLINENLVLETVNVSLADKKSSDAQEDNTISPSSQSNLENEGVSPMDTSTCSGQNAEITTAEENNALTCSGQNTEIITAEENNASNCIEQNIEITGAEENIGSGVDMGNDCHENNVIRKVTCLIDEKFFDLERARLDREYEKLMNCAKEPVIIEIENCDCIYGDYEDIFEIVVPIMKKYYPSNYIPDELCYGKILQRLQIDLAEAKMCNEDVASYTRDSIETMRYLCDHCIVQ